MSAPATSAERKEKTLMNRFSLILAVLLAAGGTDLAAQDYRFGAAYYAGGVYFTPLNPSAGSFEGASAHDIKLDPGWLVGLQFEQWFGGGRIGARLNGAFTERPIDLPGDNRQIGVWLADADLMLRIISPGPRNIVAPYISVGAGVVRYKLGRGNVLAYPPANAIYTGDDDPRWAGAAALGFDILTSWMWDDAPIGIRVEIADHVTLDSPFSEANGDNFASIHNVRVVLGLFSGFGVLH
jgi:hypothetical protein